MKELKKSSVKSKVEAILFSTGHRISLDEISKLSRSRKEDVITALQELKREYDEKQSSLMLVEEGEFWKFTVRDHFIPMVRKIVTETELTKSVLETLAVIAFKYPILQSDLIKIRTNKAYGHLNELEASGYISRQKHSRTNLIRLTDKFFKYFDLTEQKLRDQFTDFESIAKAIKEKEEEIDKIKEEQLKKAEDLKKEDEKIKREIELLDESEEEFEVPLNVYETKPKEPISEEIKKEKNLPIKNEKVGELDIVDVEQPNENEALNSEQSSYNIEDEQINSQVKEIVQAEYREEQISETQEKNQLEKINKDNAGINLTPDMEAIVNRKVEEILNPKKRSKEENKEV